jgi:NAD(P)H-dependent FMN reductase
MTRYLLANASGLGVESGGRCGARTGWDVPDGGARAAEHLRLIAGELQMADVRTNVALSLFTDFENFTDLNPGGYQIEALDTLLGQVIAWSDALAPLRELARAA